MPTLQEIIDAEAQRRGMDLAATSAAATGSETAQPGPTVTAAKMEEMIRVEREKRRMLEEQRRLAEAYGGEDPGGERAPLFTHGLVYGLDIPATGLAAALGGEAREYFGDEDAGNASFWDRYAAGEQMRRDELDRARENAVIPPIVQEIGGGLISGRPDASAMTSVGGLASRNALAGVILGGAHGAATGEGDWRDRLMQAGIEGGIGGLTGGALGGAGALIADSALAQTGGRAGTVGLNDLLREQGQTGADAASRMRELGTGATPMDVGPNTRQAAQRIQAEGGEGRGTIDPFLRTREAGKNERLTSDVTTSVGPEVQRTQVLDDLQARKESLGPEYEAAHKGQTQPANTQSIIDDIDAELGVVKSKSVRGALEKVKDYLKLNEADQLDPSSEGLHSARQAIDDMLWDQAGRPRDIGGNEARLLKKYRKMIDDELANVGPIKGVDVKRAQIGKEERAFEEGQQIYENPREGRSPQEFANHWDSLSAGERDHILKGVNRETWRQLGINANDLTTLQKIIKTEGSWNSEKLATAIGKDKTDALMKAIEREKTFNETYQKVVQGSKTAETQSANKEGRGMLSRLISFGADVAGGPVGWDNLRRGIARKVSGAAEDLGTRVSDTGGRLSKALTNVNPDEIEQAVRTLMNQRTRAPQMGIPIINALEDRRQDKEARR